MNCYGSIAADLGYRVVHEPVASARSCPRAATRRPDVVNARASSSPTPTLCSVCNTCGSHPSARPGMSYSRLDAVPQLPASHRTVRGLLLLTASRNRCGGRAVGAPPPGTKASPGRHPLGDVLLDMSGDKTRLDLSRRSVPCRVRARRRDGCRSQFRKADNGGRPERDNDLDHEREEKCNLNSTSRTLKKPRVAHA